MDCEVATGEGLIVATNNLPLTEFLMQLWRCLVKMSWAPFFFAFENVSVKLKPHTRGVHEINHLKAVRGE